MQLPDPLLNLQIPDGIAIHGGSKAYAASVIRTAAEKAASSIREEAVMSAQEALRAALAGPQLAREKAVEAANVAFAAATAQALSAREMAFAAANEVFESDQTVENARDGRASTIAAANTILVSAIREQVISDANRAFETATSGARAVLQDANRKVDEVFNNSIHEARSELDNAVAAADTIYNQAEDALRGIYDSAVEAANKVHASAMEAARQEYDATVSIPRPLAATVGLMIAVDPTKAITAVHKGDELSPVRADVDINKDADKPFNATLRGDGKNPLNVTLNLDRLPKGKFKISGIDLGFFLFSWKIFSIKIHGEAELDNTQD